MTPRTALKAWGTMAALLLAGALGSWALQSAVARLAPLENADFSEGAPRLEQLLAALPTIARTPDAVVVFGSSMTQHGFSPETYEHHLTARAGHATAFNLGLPGADAEVQRALAERIAAQFAKAGTKAKLVLVEVTPFQLTLARSGNQHNRELDDLKLASLVSPAVLWRTLRASPSDAAHVVAIEAQGRQSAYVTAAVVGALLFDRAPKWWPEPEPPDAFAERKALARQLRDETAPAWDPATRGETRLYTPQTTATYAQWRALRTNDETLRADLQWRVETTDLLELHFDPARVAHLDAELAALASCAERVQLFLAPTNPAYVHQTPEGAARLRALVDHLAATGHPVVDLNDEHGFEPGDFIDTTHLEEERGRPKLSRRLAEF
jgi:hypothetical protein